MYQTYLFVLHLVPGSWGINICFFVSCRFLRLVFFRIRIRFACSCSGLCGTPLSDRNARDASGGSTRSANARPVIFVRDR